jgi:hypothetical protein
VHDQPARRLVVHGGRDAFSLGHGVEAIGLQMLAAELAAAG